MDEIQYAPQLLPLLKRIVDANQTKGQYFLTGSHSLSMLKGVSESLAGRVGILALSPMTTYEQTQSIHLTAEGTIGPTSWLTYYLTNPQTLVAAFTGTTGQGAVQAILRGGMPEAIKQPTLLLPTFFASYQETYLNKDVRSLTDIRNIRAFESFLRLISAYTGQEINTNQLGREADIASKTAQSWLSILQATYQWYDLPAYSNNMVKRVVSRKLKGYITDTGLACYLLKLNDLGAVLNYAGRGALFETLVVNTIKSLIETLPCHAGMYYWRTINGAEVDLVLEYNGALYPIEIKMKGSLSGYDARGLRAFRTTYQGPLPVRTGLILYAGEDCYWFTEDTIALPWNALCT